MAERSLTTLLQQRANRQPGGTAYTFIDYEVGPNGFAESLTWAQLHCRAQVVAEELRACGSSGDRAAILAPQGLDYIVAFFGALQAGFVAVLLSEPQFSVHDERVSSALRDCRPSEPDVLGSLTAAQRSIWAAQQLVPEVLFNFAVVVAINHDVDAERHGGVRIPASRKIHSQFTPCFNSCATSHQSRCRKPA